MSRTSDAAYPEPAGSSAGGRLVSLDVFRGATIVGMILVNNPGTWSAVYPPLLHAKWHGWTPTDLIFPFFLFIVGVAIALAYTKRLERGEDRGPLVKKAAKRAAILFGLGLLMAAYPFVTFEPSFGLREGAFEKLRIPGVLQRIAVCYLLVTLLFLYTSRILRQWLFVGILHGYWALMVLVPVPGYGAGRLDLPEGNLAAWLDRLILGENHLWVGAGRQWDPEGLLSTLPAIATTLLGLFAGRILLEEATGRSKAVRLAVTGAVLTALGSIWGLVFPVNKALWTSSYVLLTGGLALLALAACYWVVDLRGRKAWTRPFVVYGVNAITVFVASGILAKTLILIDVRSGSGEKIPLQAWLFRNLFLPLAEPVNASLLYAVTWILGWLVVLTVMYRRGIVWKV